MRRFQQLPPHTQFLPSIVQYPSKKEIKNSLHNTSKENLQPNKDHLKKIGFNPLPSAMTNKRSQQKDYALKLEQLLQIKLLQSLIRDILTKAKMSKPWAAKQIDMNKQTSENNCLRFISDKEKITDFQRRNSCQNKRQRENSQNYMQKTINKSKINDIESNKILKATAKKTIPVTRDKTYSCRIALKNVVFPIDQKKFQKAKLANFFEKDELISTINKKEQGDQQDLFITFESLINMDLSKL